MKAVIKSKDVDRDPYHVWNEFVRFLAMSKPNELDGTQRNAHLAFCYDAEVQNGGHLQYFLNMVAVYENTAEVLTDEAILALENLGACAQASILKRAAGQWRAIPRQAPATVEEYVENGLQMEFADLDACYYNASPTIIEILERLLENHRDAFVEIIA